jgi:peptidoglycan/xylan/chitin deacetylase (PgdA/CDA1 family)
MSVSEEPMAGAAVRNICFHGVGTPQRELEPGEHVYWVGTDQFLSILDEIATWPAVRISFDDGNASDARIALPALLQRGLTAEFFALAGRLDQPGSLSSDDVRELRREGMTIGSHGMHHRSWRHLDEPTRQAEFVTAREQLQEVAGAPVDTAACPLGQYDRGVLSSLRGLGYRHVFTSDRRPAVAGSWLQPRYSVRHQDTAAGVRAEALGSVPATRRARNAMVGAVKRWR